MTTLEEIPARLRGYEVQRLIHLYSTTRASRLLDPSDKQAIMTIVNKTLKTATGKDIHERREGP